MSDQADEKGSSSAAGAPAAAHKLGAPIIFIPDSGVPITIVNDAGCTVNICAEGVTGSDGGIPDGI